MNPSTILTLCWYERQQRSFKQKYFKWSQWQPPFHWAWGYRNVMGSPALVVSSSYRPLRSPKHTRKQTTCQPVLSASQIPGNSLLLCWRKGLKRAILEGPTPVPVPSGQPPHHQLHPWPTPTATGPAPPWTSCSLEMHSKKRSFSKGMNSAFPLSFTVINHV